MDSLTYASAALSGSNERYVAQHYMEEAKTSLEEMVADDIRYAIYLLGKINYHEGVANTEIAITESNIPKDISFTFLYEDLAKKSFKKAFEMLSTAAERGSTSAMFYLGEMHANGYGVNKSGLVALEHYYDSGHGDFEAGYREDALLALEKMLEIFPEHFLTKQLAAEIYGFKQKSQGPSQYTEIPQQSAQIQESDNTPDATVKWTQERLASRGYDAGSADGVFGQKTQTAIQEFQSDNGLPSTGAISDELIEILKTVKPKLRTLKIAATGSGFVRGSEGEILTNYHVIHECLEIRVAPSQNAVQLVATDANNDLALLKSDSAFKERGKFRGNSGLRQGDQVTVIGYPLRGLLASGPSVTTGTISALAGVGNDTRLLQISAPVQAGNSGGPLFDEFGNVVGVVVSKLDAVEVASITGDFPQNINFAINASIAKNFLDSNNVKYDVSSSAERLSTADITDKAREFTKLIECWK